MGNKRVDSMTKADAGAEIERLRKVADGEIPCDPKVSDEIGGRMRRWGTEKFRTHPTLYMAEIHERLTLMEEDFRRYVRARVVGASERLTSERITATTQSLIDENPAWWLEPDCNELFFQRLQMLYPGCCDGSAPAKTTSQAQRDSAARVVPVAPPTAPRSVARVARVAPRPKKNCVVIWLLLAAAAGIAAVILKFLR